MIKLTFKIDSDGRSLVTDTDDILTKDISWPTNNQKAIGRQYDEGLRQALVTIKNEDGTPYNLTGITPVFEGTVPDGVHRIYDNKHSVSVDPANGQFRFDFPRQVFAVAGSYKQSFFRLMKDGLSVSTLEFPFDVLKDSVISGIVPEDYISPLEDIIDQAMKIYDTGDDKVKALIADWTAKFQSSFTEWTNDYATIENTSKNIGTQLTALEDSIKKDGLLTQADLDKVVSGLLTQTDLYKAVNAINFYNQTAKASTPSDYIDIFKTQGSGIYHEVLDGTYVGLTDDAFALETHVPDIKFTSIGIYQQATKVDPNTNIINRFIRTAKSKTEWNAWYQVTLY